MADSTIKDATSDAQEIVEPFVQTHTNRVKNLINNAATVISGFAIVLTILLFAYNQGYSSVYHLPAKVIPVKLETYLSLAVNMAMLLTYGFFYIADKSSDRLLANGKFNFRAVICGAIVSLTLLNNYYFNRVVGSIACIAISIIVPIIIELILLFKYKKKCNDKPNDPKMKTNKEKTEKVKKEEFVWNRIFYILYVKNGLFVLAVCILLAPVVGMISARANPNYQTCKYDSKTYAIIVEYEDSVLVQEADVCDNTITILTNSYRYLPNFASIASNVVFKSSEFCSQSVWK